MATLQELNNFSNGTVNFTDSRPSDVIFSFPTAVNLTDQTITSQTFTLQRTIDIVEIIQPTQTLITFEVDVSAISGTTVTFGSLPAGVTVTGSGGIFTVSGIDSVSDWQAVRAPTITLPSAEHQGAFEYTCTISYTNNGTRRNKQWSVGTFKTVAELSSTSTLSCAIERPIRGFSAHPIMAVTVNEADFEKVIIARILVDATATRIRHGTNSLAFDTVATLEQTNQFDNLNNLTYQSNTINSNIFSNVTFNDTRSTYGHRIDFTVSNGYITNPDDPSSSLTNSTFIFSSTNSNINDYISQIEYWPNYNYTGEVILRIQTYYNGIQVDDFKTPITHSGAGSITTQTRTFTSNTTFEVPIEEVLYGNFTALVVGGGGGGINTSGGGGGGAIEFTPNISDVNNRSFPIVIGTGGAKRELDGGSGSVNCNGPFYATSGGQSSAFGGVASGGQGAQYYSCYNSSTTTWDHEGGDSGSSSYNATSNFPNAGYGGSPASGFSNGQFNTSSLGGGGAGAGGDATSQYGQPGPGITSSTFSGTYSNGGYGASSQHPSSPDDPGPGYDPTNYGEGGSFGNRNGGTLAPSAGFQGVVKLKVEPK